MRAVVFEEFRKPLTIKGLPDPKPGPQGLVIRVKATGLCRSDWHGWMGHDPDIKLPHVPGHELAGVVEEVGTEVRRWKPGDRVTLPFVCGCGVCPQCVSGNHQVCDHQFQPGFTHWGSFAELVAVDYADINVVRLPEEIDFVTAASLGCRFVTSFRAVVDQGRVAAGQWVVVHGCGGVGLSAIMIASAAGANVVAVDIAEDKLALARELGAAVTVNAAESRDVVEAVVEITGRRRAPVYRRSRQPRHLLQLDLVPAQARQARSGRPHARRASRPAIPMDRVIARELEILGSHGIQAHRYPLLFEMIKSGRLRPELLVGRTISLEESLTALVEMDRFNAKGVTVIDRF